MGKHDAQMRLPEGDDAMAPRGRIQPPLEPSLIWQPLIVKVLESNSQPTLKLFGSKMLSGFKSLYIRLGGQFLSL
jgi:hypothetical protein